MLPLFLVLVSGATRKKAHDSPLALELEEGGKTVPVSLLNEGSKAVKDLTGEMSETEIRIDDATKKMNTDASDTAQTLKNLDAGLNQITEEAESNKELAETEGTTVDNALKATVSGATDGKSKADLYKRTMGEMATAQTRIISEMLVSTQGSVGVLGGEAEMAQLQDSASWQGLFDTAVNGAAKKHKKVEAALAETRMKKEAANRKRQAAQGFFESLSAEELATLKESTSKYSGDLSGSFDLLKNADQSATAFTSKAQQAIDDIPLGDKVITMKTLDGAINKEERSTSEQVAEQAKAGQSSYEIMVGEVDGGYTNVAASADKQADEYVGRVDEQVALENKWVQNTENDANNLAKSILSLEQQAASDLSAGDNSWSRFSSEAGQASENADMHLKQLGNKLKQEALARGPQGKADIERTASSLASAIGEKAAKLGTSIASITDAEDSNVQAATTANSQVEAEMEEEVNKENNAATQLSSTSSALIAKILLQSRAADDGETTVKQESDDARFKLQFARSKLEQEARVGQQGYVVHEDGSLEKLEREVKSEVPKLEQPVTSLLDETMRKIKDSLASATIGQTKDLGALQSGLKEIEETLRRHAGEDHVADVEVPRLQKSTETDLRALTNMLEQLTADRERAQTEIEKASELGVMSASNDISESLEEVRAMVRDTIAERTRLFFEQITKLTNMVKNVEGNNIANNDEINSGQEYMSAKMADLQQVLADCTEKLTHQKTMGDAQIAELIEQKLPELRTSGEQGRLLAIEHVNDQMKTAMKTAAFGIQSVKSELTTTINNQAAAMQAAIQMKSQKTAIAFQANVDSIEKGLEEDKAASEMIRLASKAAGAKSAEVLANVERGAQTAQAEAVRLQEAMDKHTKSIQADANQLGEVVAEETDGMLKTSTHRLEKQRQSVSTRIMKGLNDLFTEDEGTEQSGQAALAKASAMVSSQSQAVSAAGRATTDSISDIEGRFAKTKREIGTQLGRAEREEQMKAATMDDAVTSVSDSYAGAGNRNAAVMNAMEEETAKIQQERDEAADEIVNAVAAQAKTINTENVAAFAAVDAALRTAATAESVNAGHIHSSEKSLYKLAKTLDDDRVDYQNTVSMKVSAFQQLLGKEADALKENVGYLNKYEQFTHHQEIELMNSAVDVLKHEASKSDEMFDQVELDEYMLSNDVTALMGSSEFQTLAKIFQTDEFVQKVTMDDEGMVKFLEKHEATSMPWMQKVLGALDAAHDELLEAEAKNSEAQTEVDAKSAGRTADTIKDLIGEADAEGGGIPTTQLNEITKSAASNLNAAAKQSAMQDQAVLNELQARAEGSDGMVDKATAEATEQNTKTKVKLDSATATLNGMADDVDSVLKFSSDIVKAERKRLDGRAEKLSDELFVGNPEIKDTREADEAERKRLNELDVPTGPVSDPGNPNAPSAPEGPPVEESSAIEIANEKKAKLAALLEKNSKLTVQNSKLDNLHHSLTDQVTQQLREHHVSLR